MHDIEPYYRWRDRYVAAEDKQSPFYAYVNNEFQYENKIYNYYIHPQWDHFGSNTLYMKVIFVDYEGKSAIIELIGEWNDCLHNDIMFIKREVIDLMIDQGINKFVLIGENVLNFHGSDDCYYEEWFEEIGEYGGWICGVNFNPHVIQEMQDTNIHAYFRMGEEFNNLNWRVQKPKTIPLFLESIMARSTKALY